VVSMPNRRVPSNVHNAPSRRAARVRRAAAAFLAIAGASFAVAIPRAEILEQILVKVNGEIFTKTELEARQVAVLRQRGQQIDLKSEQGDAQLRKALDEVTPQIIVDVVDDMVVVQRGKELGYRLSDDQFKTALDSIKRENKIENDEQLQAALKQENMTMADLRRNLERTMISARVEQNEVLGRVGVSEEEARKYYDSHVSEFTAPPTVTLREILVAVPADTKGMNVAADDAAKEKAAQIRARAVAGESFEKLAADLSDAPSRANAGLVGPISTKDLSPDLQKMIETMKAGDIGQPIRTQRGYLLLKLESSSGAQTMPFEQAREQISERVFTDKRQAELRKYLDKLRSEAIIEWKNPDVRKAYEEGLALRAKGTGQ
jgi:peptidyl-prolyl cis-trans isomerase SurA